MARAAPMVSSLFGYFRGFSGTLDVETMNGGLSFEIDMSPSYRVTGQTAIEHTAHISRPRLGFVDPHDVDAIMHEPPECMAQVELGFDHQMNEIVRQTGVLRPIERDRRAVAA